MMVTATITHLVRHIQPVMQTTTVWVSMTNHAMDPHIIFVHWELVGLILDQAASMKNQVSFKHDNSCLHIGQLTFAN